MSSNPYTVPLLMTAGLFVAIGVNLWGLFSSRPPLSSTFNNMSVEKLDKAEFKTKNGYGCKDSFRIAIIERKDDTIFVNFKGVKAGDVSFVYNDTARALRLIEKDENGKIIPNDRPADDFNAYILDAKTYCATGQLPPPAVG